MDQGIVVTGKLTFDNLRLDEEQFRSELQALSNPRLNPRQPLELLITEDAGLESCTIMRHGNDTTISLKRKEQIKRAMRSFAIPMRYEGISHYLLEMQAGREDDTGAQPPETREKARTLAEKIRPTAAALYHNRISLSEANRRLDDVLSDDRYEGKNLRA